MVAGSGVLLSGVGTSIDEPVDRAPQVQEHPRKRLLPDRSEEEGMDLASLRPDENLSVAPEKVHVVSTGGVVGVPPLSAEEAGPRGMTRTSTEELKMMLPDWMREQKDVDVFAEERRVEGRSIPRVRGRYTWTNGSHMEVEISDVGDAPSDALLKSLGYNRAQTTELSEEGFQLNMDQTEIPYLLQYDYETAEGSMKVLVADRFLVEVQLEWLMEESFYAVVDHQISIAMLEEMARR